MGKTKTAVISGAVEETKTSAQEYAEKKARKESKSAIEESTNTAQKKTGATSTRGKKYLQAKSKINKDILYTISDAVKVIKEVSQTKFDSSMELHIVTRKKGINLSCNLPFSTGKEKVIEVADDKTIEKLKNGKVDFDVLLATAEMMPKLVVFAKLLGPKGLMPNPKNGTIIKSEKERANFSGNTITLKTEKEAPIIHTIFGKVSQKEEELVQNCNKIVETISTKQVVKAYMKSTMSPAVKLQVN